MKCELCGKQYIALGVHLRHKHAIDPDDYREEFGILRTTPLVDDGLSAYLSDCAKRRLQDDDYLAEVRDRCLRNADDNKRKPPSVMTRAGRADLARRNTAANEEYLKKHAPKVADVLREKQTMKDVTRALGVGLVAGKKMAAMAGVEYSAQSAQDERARRAAATMRAKDMDRVAQVMAHFDTTTSAAEMCRRGGISTKTYRRWLRLGLIPRHPDGRRSQST